MKIFRATWTWLKLQFDPVRESARQLPNNFFLPIALQRNHSICSTFFLFLPKWEIDAGSSSAKTSQVDINFIFTPLALPFPSSLVANVQSQHDEHILALDFTSTKVKLLNRHHHHQHQLLLVYGMWESQKSISYHRQSISIKNCFPPAKKTEQQQRGASESPLKCDISSFFEKVLGGWESFRGEIKRLFVKSYITSSCFHPLITDHIGGSARTDMWMWKNIVIYHKHPQLAASMISTFSLLHTHCSSNSVLSRQNISRIFHLSISAAEFWVSASPRDGSNPPTESHV